MASDEDDRAAFLRRLAFGVSEGLGVKLSLLQMAVFLTCYLNFEREFTVKDLTAHLNRTPAEILRAIKSLVALDLVHYGRSPSGPLFVGRTDAGDELLIQFRATARRAANMGLN